MKRFPKMSLMMGLIEVVQQPMVCVTSTLADQLYNGHQQCKEIVSCMLLVTLYGFFMKLPSETGSQSLRCVRAAALPFDGEPVDSQVEVDQHQVEVNDDPQV